MEHEAGLRARKKQRTKADLERAAMRLFAERGFDAVTVDDIAAAVDVSARTFFRHFGSKDDVLMSFHRERLDRLRKQLASRPGDESPLVAVRQAMVAMAEDYEADKEDLFLRTRLMADTPSLVGVAASAPYYHDGSAEDLDALMRNFGTVRNIADFDALTVPQKADLKAYLESL